MNGGSGGNAGQGKGYQWIQDHLNYDGDYCLIWPFCRIPNGYGLLGYMGENYYAHRFMCEQIHGPAPSPLHETAHSCGNGHGGCAHPKHLSWKTKSENLLDCREHGTQARSYHGNRGRLTDEQVQGIRDLKGKKTQAEISGIFGVSEPTVRDIFLGRSHARPSKIKHWTPAELQQLRSSVENGMNFSQIGKLLGKHSHAVSTKAYRLGLKSGQPAIHPRDIRASGQG